MALDENILDKMVLNEEAPPEENKTEDADANADGKAEPEAEANADADGADADGGDAQPEANAEKKPVTMREYINQAPPEIREVLVNGLNSYRKDKAQLIAAITANEKCTFTKEQLAKKPVEELRCLAKLAEPVANEDDPFYADYSGQGDAMTAHGEKPLAAPVLNFDPQQG
jgi:hypothetical protein